MSIRTFLSKFAMVAAMTQLVVATPAEAQITFRLLQPVTQTEHSSARAVSADGSIVAGGGGVAPNESEYWYDATTWNTQGGRRTLGVLSPLIPGEINGVWSEVFALSDDGSVAVGSASLPPSNPEDYRL